MEKTIVFLFFLYLAYRLTKKEKKKNSMQGNKPTGEGRINSRSEKDVHRDLLSVYKEAEKEWNAKEPEKVFLISTYRNRAEQDYLYSLGRTIPGSKVTWAKFGESPHNFYPSFAIDVAFKKPSGEVSWNVGLYDRFAKIMQQKAKEAGIKITWGGDWNRDGKKDNKKVDLVHHELTEWRKLKNSK